MKHINQSTEFDSSKMITALWRVYCIVPFQMKMPISQVEYFPLPECDKTSNIRDVNKAVSEMWAKYQIHQRQVDRCDLVWNILSNLCRSEHTYHDCDNRRVSFEEETVNGTYFCFLFFLLAIQWNQEINT